MQLEEYLTSRVVKSGRTRCLICSTSSQSPAASMGSPELVRFTDFQRAGTGGSAGSYSLPLAVCNTCILIVTPGNGVGVPKLPEQGVGVTCRSLRAPSFSSTALTLSARPSHEY